MFEANVMKCISVENLKFMFSRKVKILRENYFYKTLNFKKIKIFLKVLNLSIAPV